MTAFGGLLQSASLLLTLVLAHSLVIDHLPRERWSTQLLQGALFGGTALIGMMYPVTLSPGVLFDARTVVIAIAGLFGGPVVLVVSTLIAAAFRLGIGGPGVVAGVAMILTAAGLGLSFRLLSHRDKIRINARTLSVFGLAVHIGAFAWVVVLPGPILAQVWSQVALPYVTVLPAATLLLGLLLMMQEQRQQDQQALRRGRERLIEAQRIACIGDWEWDLRSGRQDWSRQARAIYGCDPSFPPTPLPNTCTLYSDATWPGLAQALRDVQARGGPFSEDAEIVRPDGSRRWVTLRGEAHRDRSGAVVHLRGTVADISERKTITEALAREHGYLSTLIKTIPDLVWLKNNDGVYLTCNRRVEQLFGRPEEKIRGCTDFQLVAADQAAAFRRHDLKALAADQPSVNEETVTFAEDGHQELLETIKTPLRDAAGTLIGVLGIARNIGPLHDSLRALQRERDRMENLLETIDAMIVALDIDERVTLINPAGAQLLGYGAKDLEGRDWFEISTRDAASADAARAAFRCYIGSDARPDGPWTAHIRSRSGDDRMLSWRARRLRDARGKVTGSLLVGNDVSVLEELRQRIGKLAEHIPGVIYQYQQWPDGRSAFPYASQGITAIYGVDPEEVTEDAMPVFQMLHLDDIASVKQSITKSMRDLDTWRERYRVCLPDGRTIWVEGEASPEPQADGSVLWHGYIRDITEHKRAETQLRLAASVFAHSREGIIITDSTNRIVDVNPGFSRITGYDKAEVLGRDPKLLASGRHDRAFYAQLWRALETDGFWQGEIWNRREAGEIYPEMLSVSAVCDATGKVQHYIGVFSDITQVKAHEAKLNQIARYDHLTGVPNRRLLTDRLQQALNRNRRSGQIIAVAYLDLDGFKAINDRHGHAVGDRLLVNVARELREVVREEDTIARLGGDEFVLLLTDLSQPGDCAAFLDRVLARIRTVTPGDGIAQGISASIGVALCPPDVADPDALLRHADQAMYLAKEGGKNNYQVYDSEQDRIVRARQVQREQIRRAIENGELVLWFQPQVDLISREVKRVEALIRWQHPEQGLLPPARFLPSVEATELEIAIGDWVLDRALRHHLDWLDDGLHMPISINIGANHLMRPDFVRKLVGRFANTPKGTARAIELEILETAALSDFEQAMRVVADCKALGLQIALDDFGTGYSSLAYLRRLGVDRIKIDQSFVRDMMQDPDDLEIVESVIRLSSSLGRTVIAEGVETLGHAALLAWLGCPLGQGYGIARPMPADDLPAWLKQWSAQAYWPEAEPVQPHRYPELAVLVAVQNHSRWLGRFNAAIERRDLETLATLQAEPCPFSSWYLGQGAETLGKLSEFEPVGAAHSALHRNADQLISALSQGVEAASRGRSLAQIQLASDALLLAVQRLVERIRSSDKSGPSSPRETSDHT